MEVPTPSTTEPATDDLLPTIVECYRSALLAMGRSGVQACPGVNSELQQKLAELGKQISKDTTPEGVRRTETRVEEQLQQWGGQSAEYFKAKTNEIKELLLVLARTAQSLGERDQRYASQFTQFTSRLQTIANLEDLTQVRASLVQGAAELKTYGHPAGDSLLKQFAQELRSNLRASDVAGRWGGDEFVVVLDCDLAGANCQTERMRKWVFGDYTVKQPAGAGEVKVPLDASIGVAQWQQGETMEKLIERADTAMYEDKRQMQKKKAAKA